MNKEKQILALAEFEGWEELVPGHKEHSKAGLLLPYRWINKHTGVKLLTLPNYLEDLNAIHNLIVLGIRSLSMDTKFVYELQQVIARSQPSNRTADMEFCDATAAQRCEALLRLYCLLRRCCWNLYR